MENAYYSLHIVHLLLWCQCYLNACLCMLNNFQMSRKSWRSDEVTTFQTSWASSIKCEQNRFMQEMYTHFYIHENAKK